MYIMLLSRNPKKRFAESLDILQKRLHDCTAAAYTLPYFMSRNMVVLSVFIWIIDLAQCVDVVDFIKSDSMVVCCT